MFHSFFLEKSNLMALRNKKGFTLAELLIALGILGMIAAFTIPKILASQQNQQYNAAAKEAISAVAAAYQQYQANNTITSSFHVGNLTQYLNYVSVDTSSTVDDVQGYGTYTCSTGLPCLIMHSGARLYYSTNDIFSGTETTNATIFYIDPDNAASSTTNAPGKSIRLYLYTTGKLTSLGTVTPATVTRGVTTSACPACDPPWFSW